MGSFAFLGSISPAQAMCLENGRMQGLRREGSPKRKIGLALPLCLGTEALMARH